MSAHPGAISRVPPAIQATGQRKAELDGLRGVAVTLVLVHHFVVPLINGSPGSLGSYVAAALSLTYTGVDLFFVLSGYLIGGILLDQRDSPTYFRAFYIRRTARIVPLAYLCVLLTLGAEELGWVGAVEGGAPWSVGVYLLFVSNLWMAGTGGWGYHPLAQLWSLGIEEQFYLTAPWVVRLVRPAALPWLAVAIVVVSPLVRLAFLAVGGSSLAASMVPIGRMDGLGLGMLAAWSMRAPEMRAWLARSSRKLVGVLVVAVMSCALLTKLRAGNGSFPMAAGGYTVVALSYALLIVLMELGFLGGIKAGLMVKPLVWLGQCSYFLYLFQFLFVGMAVGLIFHGRAAVMLPATWLQLGTGLVCLMAAAQLSWRWLETPLLRLGRRAVY